MTINLIESFKCPSTKKPSSSILLYIWTISLEHAVCLYHTDPMCVTFCMKNIFLPPKGKIIFQFHSFSIIYRSIESHTIISVPTKEDERRKRQDRRKDWKYGGGLILLFSFETKNERNYFLNSTLASKMSRIKKMKARYYIN